MLSWGRIRRELQPFVLKYWLNQRAHRTVTTRVEGFEIEVFPTVFHPRYFGSSSILARFVSSLPLAGKAFLDLGCGSGIVAMCAGRGGAAVTAVDINPEAVRCAEANAVRHNLQLDTRVSDLFASLAGQRFDVIAWNPPFLPGVPKSAAEAAFYGGPNFDVIRTFADNVHAHLLPDAAVYTVLSADIDLHGIEQLFKNRGFAVSRVLSTRWGLGETMVILCAR